MMDFPNGRAAPAQQRMNVKRRKSESRRYIYFNVIHNVTLSRKARQHIKLLIRAGSPAAFCRTEYQFVITEAYDIFLGPGF
jgi:hypothetical protein